MRVFKRRQIMQNRFGHCSLILTFILLFTLVSCNNSQRGQPEAWELCGLIASADLQLTQDIDCRENTNNTIIKVTQDDVTVDCMGHAIFFHDDRNGCTILVSDVANVTIKNCKLVGGNTGICAKSVTGLKVENNYLVDMKSFGVLLTDVSEFSISDNFVMNQTLGMNGIEIMDSEKGEVKNNFVTRFGSGINLNGGRDITVSGNRVDQISDTGLGFFDYEGIITQRVIVHGNHVSGCRNIGSVEIMDGSRDITFSRNRFENGAHGVLIYDDKGQEMSDLKFVENLIQNNNGGISVLNSAGRITILGNRFLRNERTIVLEDSGEALVEGNLIEQGLFIDPWVLRPISINAKTQAEISGNRVFGFQNITFDSNDTNIRGTDNRAYPFVFSPIGFAWSSIFPME